MTVGEILNVRDFDWMIHEHDSKFKVMDGKDGTTVHETTDLTDALTAFDYCAGQGGLTFIKRRTHVTDKHYPLSDAVDIDATTKNHVYFTGVAGKMVTDVEIRPTNNTPAFILTGGTNGTVVRSSLENLYFSQTQAGYTKSLVQILNSGREIMLSGLRFGPSGSGLFKGNGIGFELLNADVQQYEIKVENIIARDMENAFYFNVNQPDSGGTSDFISSLIFDSVFAWNCKRVALATGVSGAKLMAIDFDKIHYQYSASNPLLTNGTEAVYDFSSVLNSWWIKIAQSMTWDIPAGSNNLNTGATTDVVFLGSNLPTRVGGTGGVARVGYEGDYRSIREGEFVTNGIVGQKDYTVSHGLGIVPRYVFVTNVSDDGINRQLGVTVPKASIGTTNFTVRFVDPPVAGTNNVKIHWRAFL